MFVGLRGSWCLGGCLGFEPPWSWGPGTRTPTFKSGSTNLRKVVVASCRDFSEGPRLQRCAGRRALLGVRRCSLSARRAASDEARLLVSGQQQWRRRTRCLCATRSCLRHRQWMACWRSSKGRKFPQGEKSDMRGGAAPTPTRPWILTTVNRKRGRGGKKSVRRCQPWR